MSTTIETERLILIPGDPIVLQAVFQGDQIIRELLGVNVLEKWTEFGEPVFRYSYQKILTNPDELGWWAYLPIYRPENILVGSCGYKGHPDAAGIVEIGYEVAEAYRNRGLATEMAQALVKRAWQHPGVYFVQAHTLAQETCLLP
ncbi:MAG: GNAT family N-acetyltransferase, partial [Bacteroidia bacterium]|nr:GNAT family N-acetyltransferase [Bacteroidia bacterium]